MTCYVSGNIVINFSYMMPFQFMDAPARTCWLAVKGAVRSTAFLSAFVGIFQVAVS
jgi:hypothetical protein